MKKRLAQVILLSGMALLAACSSMQSDSDGPPLYNVDVSKIPDAVPKDEPRSKYGNPASYKVRGKRYYVMNSAHGYHERGMASWYGTKFHKHRTSSGEPYNMLGMTAASRTLPLPTYARVTNLENGKQVIVKVNDRGPFEKSRVMDLSYVAAKKLGMLGRGTAHVDIQAIEPHSSWFGHKETTAPTVAEETSSYGHEAPSVNKHTYLQVGAFKSKQNAQHVERQIAQLVHHPVRVKSVGHAYRVQIGPLASSSSTYELSTKLAHAGYHKVITVTE